MCLTLIFPPKELNKEMLKYSQKKTYGRSWMLGTIDEMRKQRLGKKFTKLE